MTSVMKALIFFLSSSFKASFHMGRFQNFLGWFFVSIKFLLGTAHRVAKGGVSQCYNSSHPRQTCVLGLLQFWLSLAVLFQQESLYLVLTGEKNNV